MRRAGGCYNLAPVVRRVDNVIRWINAYQVDKIGTLSNHNYERANFIRWIKLSTLRTNGPEGHINKGISFQDGTGTGRVETELRCHNPRGMSDRVR